MELTKSSHAMSGVKRDYSLSDCEENCFVFYCSAQSVMLGLDSDWIEIPALPLTSTVFVDKLNSLSLKSSIHKMGMLKRDLEQYLSHTKLSTVATSTATSGRN